MVLVHVAPRVDASSGRFGTSGWAHSTRAATPPASLVSDPDLDIRGPFYGTRLDELTALPPPGQVVARGLGDEIPDPFQAELVLELAERAGVTDAEIATETVARGPQNWEWCRLPVGC